jgi:hypothetical protein
MTDQIAGVDGRAWAERQVVIALSGPAAERISREGSAPGWNRCLSQQRLKEFHESGHLVCAMAAGNTVYRAIRVGRNNSYLGGFVDHGSNPTKTGPVAEPVSLRVEAGSLECDLHKAVRLCALLAGAHADWRSVLRIARELRARAEALIRANWQHVAIASVALRDRKTLDQAEIEQLFGRGR